MVPFSQHQVPKLLLSTVWPNTLSITATNPLGMAHKFFFKRKMFPTPNTATTTSNFPEAGEEGCGRWARFSYLNYKAAEILPAA